jgi:Gas vesicle protein K
MSSLLAGESLLHETTASGEHPDFSDRLAGDVNALDDFARELRGRNGLGDIGGEATGRLPRRVNADAATGEKDLAKLVLALVELVRQLMERQAVRRVNAGSLSEEQVERMGETFLKLDQRMAELRAAFGLQAEDLNLCLGPLGDLLPRERARATSAIGPRMTAGAEHR